MEEKVDILLASYNGEKYIKQQIESILNQTYQNVRVIISDDCSQDGTRQILKEYEQNEKVKIFYQEENLGYVKNFEFLLKQVESNFYMLSDQDDVWKKEKVEKEVTKLKEENLSLVFSDLEVVDENLNTIIKSYNTDRHFNKKIQKCLGSYKLQYLYNVITGCTILSKKEFIEKIVPIPINSKYVIHDFWIGLIVNLNGKVGYINEPLVLYRQHNTNQVGSDKIGKKYNKISKIREELISEKIGIFETYVEHNKMFSKEVQEQNVKALEYFKILKNKKCINFKGWTTFNKLYKDEDLSIKVKNFIMLNM